MRRLLLCCLLLPAIVIAQPTVKINVNPAESLGSLHHPWPYFGFDECNLSLTDAGQALFRELANTFDTAPYIRAHNLLNTGDTSGDWRLKWSSSNAYTENRGQPVYEWSVLDRIMDATLANGCRPLVEIGFMPKALSTEPEPYEHNWEVEGRLKGGWRNPPRDYEKWAGLMRAWARHSQNRYGDAVNDWIWDVWNEPDGGFWVGTIEEYIKLYDYTENAIRGVLPDAIVGGPHVTAPSRIQSQKFFRQFLRHCVSGTNAVTGAQGTRLDYISFHSKGRTTFVDGHPRMNLKRNLESMDMGFGIVREFPEYHRTPIIIGEADPEGTAARSARVHPPNGYRNGEHYAAYTTALMAYTLDLAARHDVNLQGVLTWAFLFDERDYFEGFRTLSTNGIAKPVLNAFRMFTKLGNQRVALNSGGAIGASEIIENSVPDAPDINGMATADERNVTVLLWNYHDDIIPAKSAPVSLTVQTPVQHRGAPAKLTHYRIDKNHSNAFTVWNGMGSPQKPSDAQLSKLHQAAELTLLEQPRNVTGKDGTITLDFDLPRHGVSLIELSWE
jgi:xylan 1,4-beta-xylosidase